MDINCLNSTSTFFLQTHNEVGHLIIKEYKSIRCRPNRVNLLYREKYIQSDYFAMTSMPERITTLIYTFLVHMTCAALEAPSTWQFMIVTPDIVYPTSDV